MNKTNPNLILLCCTRLVEYYLAKGFVIIQHNCKCWDKSINGKSINGPPMHAERAHYVTCRKKCFISYVHISHVDSLASIDTSV